MVFLIASASTRSYTLSLHDALPISLTELRVLADGKDVIVEREGARLEPLSGQFVLNFETRQLEEEVQVISERGADEWFALALDYEADRANRKTWAEAIHAYENALRQDPQRTDA